MWRRPIPARIAVDIGVGVLVLLSYGLGTSRTTLLVLLSAIPFVAWTAIIAGLWWMAPMFQSLRDGSLPTLPPFPVRSLLGPVLLAAEMTFKGYLLAEYGILALLAVEALLQLFSLLDKHVAGAGHQP